MKLLAPTALGIAALLEATSTTAVLHAAGCPLPSSPGLTLPHSRAPP